MTCLEFQQTQPKEKIIHHEAQLRPWEAEGADTFHFNNINYLCVVDYNSKFPIVWKGYLQNTSLMQYQQYSLNMVYHVNLCLMQALVLFQKNSHLSADLSM